MGDGGVRAQRPSEGSAQRASCGGSDDEIHGAVLAAADSAHGLSWLDIGCGTGHVLRSISQRYEPTGLVGIDVIDWLADDLRGTVDMRQGGASTELAPGERFDRVLMVESLEHVDDPWGLLRRAAHALTADGRIVMSTPNVLTLRSRLELLVRGHLTAFRPANPAHLTPVLPHVVQEVLLEEGLDSEVVGYTCADVVPLTGGRRWPSHLARRLPRLLRISVVIRAWRLETPTDAPPATRRAAAIATSRPTARAAPAAVESGGCAASSARSADAERTSM